MVMTDAQMAEAAKPEVLNEAILRKIDGFGEARIGKYAARLIKGCHIAEDNSSMASTMVNHTQKEINKEIQK